MSEHIKRRCTKPRGRLHRSRAVKTVLNRLINQNQNLAAMEFAGMVMTQNWGHTPAAEICRDRFPQDQRIHKSMASMGLITTLPKHPAIHMNRVPPPRGELATGPSRADGMIRARLPMRGSTS